MSRKPFLTWFDGGARRKTELLEESDSKMQINSWQSKFFVNNPSVVLISLELCFSLSQCVLSDVKRAGKRTEKRAEKHAFHLQKKKLNNGPKCESIRNFFALLSSLTFAAASEKGPKISSACDYFPLKSFFFFSAFGKLRISLSRFKRIEFYVM